MLKNKPERFAQALATGMSARAAYAAAGYKPNDANAIRLSKNEQIKTRVTELQQPAIEKFQLTREWVLEKLFEHRAIAMSQPKPDISAANRATELLGKELSMFVDRVESDNRNYQVSDKPVTEQQWEEEWTELPPTPKQLQ